MSEAKVHTGGCHCGTVRFEATMDTSKATACNCSICGKTGTWYAFVPAEQFKLLSGKEALKDYQFAKKHIHHQFCTNCGVRSFGHGAGPGGKEMVAVNVRCIDGIDLKAVEVTHFNGKDL
jgi:hypothetical protein